MPSLTWIDSCRNVEGRCLSLEDQFHCRPEKNGWHEERKLVYTRVQLTMRLIHSTLTCSQDQARVRKEKVAIYNASELVLPILVEQ